jgi:hypothetical protein
MRDNVSRLGTIFTGLAALPVNKANITGQTIYLPNYNAATLYILCGSWTDGTHTFVIQESPDGSNWTNVANTDLVAWSAPGSTVFYPPVRNGSSQPIAISSAATAVNQRVGYIGQQPYVRVIVNVTGSPSTGAAYDCIWILGEPRNMPSAV